MMNTLTTFAQYYTDYNSSYGYDSTTYDPAAFFAILFVILIPIFFIAIITYVAVAFCLMSIFKKAGVKPWIAWVPFYNQWKLLEIGGQPGFWAVLLPIPVVDIISFVFIYISMYHIGKKLGKEGAFVLLAIFLPIVWYIWLAVDSSKWDDKASSAPSLAK